MRRQAIIDVVPISRNGETVYIETRLAGFGVTQAQFVNTATNVTSVVSAAASAVPTKPVSVQSDFSKTTNVVATGAGTVAAVAALIPGIGTVVAVVAGVVAAAAILLGKIFGNSKSKQYAAERGEYEKVNAQIKYENTELDKQYDATARAIAELKSAIASLSGMPLNGQGLGLCLKNCKEEKAKLQSAKDEYEVLQREQQNKTQLMASLLDEYNRLIKGLLQLKSDQKTKDYLTWILLAGALAAVGYLTIKRT